MGACLSKKKKRTTKSKNFGTVNFKLTSKHTVNNVVGTKNQRQHRVKNSEQDLPNLSEFLWKKNQFLGGHVYISERKEKVVYQYFKTSYVT